MTPEDLAQFLRLISLVARPLATRTSTTADDIGVEFVEAVAASPALLAFASKYLKKDPQALSALVTKLAS